MKSRSYTVPKRWSWQEAHTGCPHYIALIVLCIFSQDFSLRFLVHATSDMHVFYTSVVLSSGTFSSVLSVGQFTHSVVFTPLWPHGLQHTRFPVLSNSQSLLRFMSIELVMPSSHLILYCPLFLLPSIFASINVFSSESVLHIRWPKYWSFRVCASTSVLPMNIQDWFPLGLTGLISL